MNDKEYVKDLILREIVGVAGLLFGIYLTRKVMQPDFGRTAVMRIALAAKRAAQGQADLWQKAADHAGTVYNKART